MSGVKVKVFNKSGFTLVEIMIVVAIIALLAAIAIPNLMRAKVNANDAFAQNILRAMSTASETFGSSNAGNYPSDMTSLIGITPPYLSTNYCGVNMAGFTFTCTAMGLGGYTFVATPTNVGTTGSTTYTMVTGGIMTP